MERRDFLKLAFGVAAGVSLVAVAGPATAAPLMATDPLKGPKPEQPDLEAKPAIATEQDIADANAEQVQYYGYGYRRRYYRRRYYRPRYYRRSYYRPRFYY